MIIMKENILKEEKFFKKTGYYDLKIEKCTILFILNFVLFKGANISKILLWSKVIICEHLQKLA